jgi:hypothetical protein
MLMLESLGNQATWQTFENRGAEPPANKRTTLTMEEKKEESQMTEFEGRCVMLAYLFVWWRLIFFPLLGQKKIDSVLYI